MSSQPIPLPNPDPLPWYALRTRSNQERTAAHVLSCRGYESYVPSYGVTRRWSDRTVNTLVPLFPGYVFCRFNANLRLPIVSTPGVVSVVGFGKDPAAIADSEIEAIQTVLQSGLVAEQCAYLREGQHVRICQGAMKGVEGILLKKKSEWRLVVSVSMLERSISVEVDHHSVETI